MVIRWGWVAALVWMGAGCSLFSSKSAGNCSVSRDEDAGIATIRCPDGTATVLHDGAPGLPGTNGTNGAPGSDGNAGAAGSDGRNCSVSQVADAGFVLITCPDGTSATVHDGVGCTATRDADAGVTHITCADGTSATIVDGKDGMSCTAVDNGDGSKTIRCPDGTSVTVANGKDGTQGTPGQNGHPGTSCTVTHDGGVAVVACADGTSAVLPDASAATDGGATVTVEPPGPNCVHGGVAITSGTTTQYVCNVSPASVLSVVTAAASAISYRDAVLGGTVTLTGSDVVLGKGVCYDTAAGVTLSSTCVTMAGGTGAFGMAVSGLLPGTAYYVRAFATSASGTALGNEVSFQASPLAVPTVSTDTPLNVSRNSARSGGNVSEWGGSAVLARGLCWSTSHAPTLADAKVLAGADVGAFTADATGLTPGTTYYARAFATNAQGTGYGQEVAFTTTALPLPVLTTAAPTAVSYRSASASGSISSDEGSPVTARGVVYATHPGPTRVDSSIFAGAGIGTISASLTGLLPSTTYYLRAWAENAGGTAYGDERAFTTLSLTTPTLTTTSAGGISNTTANSGGNITDDGGTNVTARGVCWSTAPLPTLAGSCTSDGTGAGAFSSLIGSLTPNTTYYVRAYATNSNGSAFGNQGSFTTTNAAPLVGAPLVGTGQVTMTAGTTATARAFISSDNGSAITDRGFCWDLATNPTIANNCISAGTGAGQFTSTLTGLGGCNVSFHVRAYAVNANGIAYGNDVQFATGLAPSISTTPIMNLDTTSALVGGIISDDGGCPVTARGVYYGVSNDPGLDKPRAIQLALGIGAGEFSGTISNLLSNFTYYVRSYATNSKGTTYGQSKMFTTLTPVGLYLGQSYGGGIIYELDATGQHGKIAVGTQTVCTRTLTTGFSCVGADSATSRAAGTGPQNTTSVMALCPGAPAETYCDSLILGGANDWYVPPLDESIEILALFYWSDIGNLTTICHDSGTTMGVASSTYTPTNGTASPLSAYRSGFSSCGTTCGGNVNGYQTTSSFWQTSLRCTRNF